MTIFVSKNKDLSSKTTLGRLRLRNAHQCKNTGIDERLIFTGEEKSDSDRKLHWEINSDIQLHWGNKYSCPNTADLRTKLLKMLRITSYGRMRLTPGNRINWPGRDSQWELWCGNALITGEYDNNSSVKYTHWGYQPLVNGSNTTFTMNKGENFLLEIIWEFDGHSLGNLSWNRYQWPQRGFTWDWYP